MNSNKISEEDKELFRQAMAKAKPLSGSNRVEQEKSKPKLKKKAKIKEALPRPERYIYAAEPVAREAILYYAKSGMDPSRLRDLKRGKFKIAASLDLHGFSQQEAGLALEDFLQKALSSDWQYVLIIHGKGRGPEDEKPILKNFVNQYLRSVPEVLGFCSAKISEGGVGAVYVLLKRTRMR